MFLVDTHCHLNNEQFADERELVIARSLAADVKSLVCISWDAESSTDAARLSQQPGIYAVLGVHPVSGNEWDEEARSTIAGLFAENDNKIVGYGEIGLDYHWETVPPMQQQQVFREQLEFAGALRTNMAVVIHCRDAHDDTLAILKESQYSGPILWHCFGDDLARGREIMDAGYWLGIGGVLTYKKSGVVRECVKELGLSRIVLETDSPYLSPQGLRGKRNEPANVREIARFLADTMGVSTEDVAEVTTRNASTVYGVDFESER